MSYLSIIDGFDESRSVERRGVFDILQLRVSTKLKSATLNARKVWPLQCRTHEWVKLLELEHLYHVGCEGWWQAYSHLGEYRHCGLPWRALLLLRNDRFEGCSWRAALWYQQRTSHMCAAPSVLNLKDWFPYRFTGQSDVIFFKVGEQWKLCFTNGPD